MGASGKGKVLFGWFKMSQYVLLGWTGGVLQYKARWTEGFAESIRRPPPGASPKIAGETRAREQRGRAFGSENWQSFLPLSDWIGAAPVAVAGLDRDRLCF